ncbi:acyl-CoA dehydrogenase [Psychrobacter alimentarius]|uniref:acyl-CoA dehydrogenase n=1 Tax=Psychrobacter alimentarius TaxID=261164 RepID=UPI003FD387B7
MWSKNIKNDLLEDIENAVNKVIITNNQEMSTLNLTTTLRCEILNILVSYSRKIPHPASGMAEHNRLSNTLIRWQVLAYVASIDLTLAKWFESHLDALSILDEIGYSEIGKGLWAVWAAEGHSDPLRYEQGKAIGHKAWCSGANIIDQALVTYRNSNNQSQLLIIDMHQAGIEIDNNEWQAVGMEATDTATVKFCGVSASLVGKENAYLDRVGFWHGAAGVAACWYGASAYLANYLITAYQQKPNNYKAMYLGEIATVLAVTQQYFYHVAHLIDTEPSVCHELAIRQLRVQVEKIARHTVEIVGQALGAAPFCRNAHFARLSSDLSVFIRQSHGAFDLQKIGELTSFLHDNLTHEQANVWQL